MTLKLRNVPAASGWRWLRNGFAVMFRQPLPYVAMFGSFLLGSVVLLMVPWVGSLLMMAWLPLVTLAFMLATHQVLQRRMPTPMLLLRPLQHNGRRRAALIRLGLVYAVATLVIVLLGEWADGGKFARLQELVVDPDKHREEIAALLEDGQLRFGILMRLVLAALLSIPFWHAPALVYWDRQGPAQALFSSTLAVWRARNAFFVYGLAWALTILVFSVVTNLAFALLGVPQLAGLTALAAGLTFSTAFYASLYFTFADSFEISEHGVIGQPPPGDAAPAPVEPTGGQEPPAS